MIKVKHSLISPRFFQEYRDLDDFVGEYGFHQWRFNLAVPDSEQVSWLDAFRAWVSELDVIDAKRARRLLELGRIREALIEYPRLPTNLSDSWGSTVQNLELSEYDVIVGDSLCPEPFDSWDRAVPKIRDSRTGEIRFKATVTGFLGLLRPLIPAAPSLYLVDPYLIHSNDDQIGLIEALLREMKGSRCFQLHLITRNIFSSGNKKYKNLQKSTQIDGGNSKEEFLKLLNDRFVKQVPNQRALYVHLVDDRSIGPTSLRLHGRYALNRTGSLRLDKGFTLTGAIEEASTVDRKSHEERWRLYSDHVVCFDQHLSLQEGQRRPYDVETIEIK